VFPALVIFALTLAAPAGAAALPDTAQESGATQVETSKGEPTEAEVRAWLEAEIERASNLDLPAPFAVKWTYEDYNVLSGNELAALRAEVAGKPFHPRRPELEAAERQVREGKTLMHLLWLRDNGGRWRFGIEHPGMIVTDTGYGPNESWRLSNGTLKLFDHRVVEAGTDPTQSPRSREYVFRPDLQAVFFGSLSSTRALGIGIKELSVAGEQWHATFEPATPSATSVIAEFTCRWSEADGRGFVERVRYARHPQPEFQGHTETFEGWKKLGETGPWAATTINRLDGKGRTWRRITRVEFVELSAAELKQALDVPVQGATDPFRGTIAIKEEADYTTGVVTDMAAATAGGESTRAIPGFAANQGLDWRNVVGWAVLGAIGVFIAVLVARRFGYLSTSNGART